MTEYPVAVAGPRARRISPVRQGFYIAFLIFAAVVLYGFAVKGLVPFRVPSNSMLPTLRPGDFIFAVPQKEYHRGDIVVLHDPLQPGGYLVKRLAGMPGDRIEIDYGYMAVNGKYASEPYLPEPINYALGEQDVAEGEVLVLGDNRNESDDASRWLIDPATGQAVDASNRSDDMVNGKKWKRTVPLSTIVGKVVYRYLPFDRMGFIESFPLTNSEGE